MQVVIYDKQTGEIYSVATARDAAEAATYANSTRGALVVADGAVPAVDTYWVENAVVKAASPVTMNLSTQVAAVNEQVTISGLPNPCWIHNSKTDALVQVTTGSYTFTNTVEGRIAITLQGKYYGQAVVRFSALAASKAKAKLEIDAAAEEARLRVVTPGAGQAMTYLRKADAATAYLAGDTLSEPQMQRIEDEAARLGLTLQQAAETLAATATAWEGLDAAIDNIRLTAKQNIDNAATGAAVDAVMKGLSWPV